MVRSQTRILPLAVVTPRFANFVTGLLGGVTLGRWKPPKAGATCGRGAGVGPTGPGWLQRGPCAAPSDAPSSGPCPCGGSCSSGNCSHPGPGSGYSPPPPASRARRESLTQVCSEYFPPVRKTALRPASFPAFPPLDLNEDSPVSLSPGTLLGGQELCVGQVLFLDWRSVNTRGRGLHCESQDLWTWVRVGHTQFWQSLDFGRTVDGLMGKGGGWGDNIFRRQDTPVLLEVWGDGLSLGCLQGFMVIVYIWSCCLGLVGTSWSIFHGETSPLCILFYIISALVFIALSVL